MTLANEACVDALQSPSYPATKKLDNFITLLYERLAREVHSLDMVEIVGTYKPALWVYGHTHECDDQMIRRTRIISNQLGYGQ